MIEIRRERELQGRLFNPARSPLQLGLSTRPSGQWPCQAFEIFGVQNKGPRSSSREARIRVPFLSVVYFGRGTLPKKRVKGHYWETYGPRG